MSLILLILGKQGHSTQHFQMPIFLNSPSFVTQKRNPKASSSFACKMAKVKLCQLFSLTQKAIRITFLFRPPIFADTPHHVATGNARDGPLGPQVHVALLGFFAGSHCFCVLHISKKEQGIPPYLSLGSLLLYLFLLFLGLRGKYCDYFKGFQGVRKWGCIFVLFSIFWEQSQYHCYFVLRNPEMTVTVFNTPLQHYFYLALKTELCCPFL